MIFESKSNNSQESIVNKKSSLPYVAGFLLILVGIIAIISWIPFVTGDQILTQLSLENFNVNLTEEQIKESFSICGSIGIILSIFPIFGGILAFKRKFWNIAIFCSILGLFTVGSLFLSTILSFIGMVLLFICKKDFQKTSKPFS